MGKVEESGGTGKNTVIALQSLQLAQFAVDIRQKYRIAERI